MAAHLQAWLEQGTNFHRQGKLAEAKALYEAILAQDPEHAGALSLLGTLALHAGDPAAAVAVLDRAIAIDPRQPLAHNGRGTALVELGRPDQALASFDTAVGLAPDYAEAHNNRGVALMDLNRPAEALVSHQTASSLVPTDAGAHANSGNALMSLGRFDAALASYDAALALAPHHVIAHNNRGMALMELTQPARALESYDRVLALRADYAEAHNNRGNALLALKRPDEALASYARGLSIKPNYMEAHYNRGNALMSLGRLPEALESYDAALAIDGAVAAVHNNRGTVLKALKREDEAFVSFSRAVALKPDDAEMRYNRGTTLLVLDQLDEALADFDAALGLRPDYAQAHNGRGNVFSKLNRPEEALTSYDKALTIAPQDGSIHRNRAGTLAKLNRNEEALAAYDTALALNPEDADGYNDRGNLLVHVGQFEHALASYEAALSLKPDHPFLRGVALNLRLRMGDWTDLSNRIETIRTEVLASRNVSPPLPLCALIDDPALHRHAAQLYADSRRPKSKGLGVTMKRAGADKIRLGYYSADFRDHPVARLIAKVFELHDRAAFEVIGFSYGPDAKDTMRKRLSVAFDTFIDIRQRSDRDVVKLSRDLGIDIAIDLTGYTQHTRPEIFAEGCAPIQVSYLGYPGTTAADYIDYVIADEVVIPPGARGDFTEKVIYLPNSYQANDSGIAISARTFTRRDCGLPETGFVFCCFNNSYKILPATFDIWMRLLTAVEGSVLWLLEDNPAAVKNFRREAEARGVDGRRLVFAMRMPFDTHLARHGLADIFLDTFPYNAHTTASDALWAGLPLLTYTGKSFASRVAASLLYAVGLPELVAASAEDYEAKAVELATQPSKLSALRHRLAANRSTAPLFDSKSFVKDIEAAYRTMYARWSAGLKPESFKVGAPG